MGTNYYAELPPKNICEHCKRGDGAEELHIGKSSGGWCFSLHVIEGRIESLEDWIVVLAAAGVRIKDEYGKYHTLDEMLKIITQRRCLGESDKEWYSSNHAERGPNGLARHKVDLQHRHGKGTWDLCMGEFS
jgi:hypothetical protein